MAVVRNLLIVPALKVDASTWFPTPEWARTAAAHSSLPRSTAFAGTTAAQVVCSRTNAGAITPGKYAVFTVSIRAVGPQTGSLGLDWRDSSNGFLSSTSGAGSDHGTVNMTAGTTQRFGVIGQAPALADRVTPVVNGLDAGGGAQVTAAMLRVFDTLPEAEAALAVDLLPGNYVDGDTPGASWDGDDGESTSTLVRDEPASGVAEFAGMAAGGLGVRRHDGAGEALMAGLLASTGLFATALYDDRRGRIRISCSGLASNVVRVVVYARAAGATGRWHQVRGGKVAVVGGQLTRPVDDYEYRAGGGMRYRIDALSTKEEETDAVVQTAYADVADTEARVWLKFIAAPYTNLVVNLVVDDWELTQAARSVVHEIPGRIPPVVVSDVHGATRTVVRFLTRSNEDRDALRTALSQGAAAYLQTPDSVPFPTMYVSIGNHRTVRWGGRSSFRWVTSVEVVEVDAPPPSVVGTGATWAQVLDRFATWEEVLAEYDSWLELVQ